MNGDQRDRRVAAAGCGDYGTENVERAVRRAVDLLGGMSRFVKPGQRVVIKPNFVLPTHPDRAAITHPSVGRAVALLVQEAGGLVLIADSPGASPPTRLGWQNTYARMGWGEVASQTGAELSTHVDGVQRLYPEGKLIRVVDTSTFITESDVVISVPKLKSHGLMRYTGAVKNLFGTVPGVVKFGYHAKLQSVDQFADMLLDVAGFVRPALTIVDAIVAMDGDGPTAGDPFSIGAILAGSDPVAVDVAGVSLIGHEPTAIPTIARAIHRGWSTGRLSDIEWVGDSLASLQVAGFRLPAGGSRSRRWVPGFARRLGTRHLVARPVISDRCINCGRCIENCPVDTISRSNGRADIELADCIRCYCCHELCPVQAVDLHEPGLGRFVNRIWS